MGKTKRSIIKKREERGEGGKEEKIGSLRLTLPIFITGEKTLRVGRRTKRK